MKYKMKEEIRVDFTNIDNPLISARELYAALVVPISFDKWCEEWMEYLDFPDTCKVAVNEKFYRPNQLTTLQFDSIDYHLDLDTAAAVSLFCDDQYKSITLRASIRQQKEYLTKVKEVVTQKLIEASNELYVKNKEDEFKVKLMQIKGKP